MRFLYHARSLAMGGELEPIEQFARRCVRVAVARVTSGERRDGDVLERGQPVEDFHAWASGSGSVAPHQLGSRSFKE